MLKYCYRKQNKGTNKGNFIRNLLAKTMSYQTQKSL